MQRAHLLLLDRLDGHGPDIRVAVRLQQGFGIRAVGLVPRYIGTDVLRRQKHHRVSHLSELSTPMMGPATGLEHHGRRLALGKELKKARAGQPPAFVHPPGTSGDGDFEDGLLRYPWQSSYASWQDFSSFVWFTMIVLTLAPRCRTQSDKEESISSLKLAAGGGGSDIRWHPAAA